MNNIESILTKYQLQMERITDALEKHVDDCGKKGDRMLQELKLMRKRLDKIERRSSHSGEGFAK